MLMGLSGNDAIEERARLNSFFSNQVMAAKRLIDLRSNGSSPETYARDVEFEFGANYRQFILLYQSQWLTLYMV
jgi:hypothetical protein